MLSAVENHFGPNRPYATASHHYASASGSNLLTAPCPIDALPAAMSAAEFARPHPKTTSRYNGSQSLRGCNIVNSSRGKYSQIDQSGPVDLAVPSQLTSTTSTRHSPPISGIPLNHKQSSLSSDSITSVTSSLKNPQSQIQPDNSIASLYGTSKLYAAPVEAFAAYHQSLYGHAAASIYGPSALYPPPSHGLGNNRSTLHHSRSAYSHVEPYPNSYLLAPPPSAYSPPAAARPGLSPQSPIGAITMGSATVVNVSQNNTSISTKPVLPTERLSSSSSPSSSTSSSASLSPPSSAHPHQYSHQQQQQQQQQQLHNEHNLSSGVKITAPYRSDKKEKESKTNSKSSDFKIPSGKEGSLKHRILTRPYSEKETSNKQIKSTSLSNSQTNKSSFLHSNNGKNTTITHNSNNNNNISSCTKFSKGSVIELSTGEFKRVEDMRAEDFLVSSNKNPELQLIDTTVVKIVPHSKYVMITLAYNNSKIDIETTAKHPFFVYGKGWASHNPEGSLEEYGLKCQLLVVGDVCISLAPREMPLNIGTPLATKVPSVQPYIQHQPQFYAQPHANTNYTHDNGAIAVPQNLARYETRKQPPHTIPTTATTTAVSSRPTAPFDYQSSMYGQSFHNHNFQQQQQHLINEQNMAMRTHFNQQSIGIHRSHGIDDRRNGNSITLQRTLSHDSSPRKYNVQSSMAPPPPPPPSTNSDTSIARDNLASEEAFDATTHSSRKRRWSAPDNICDVDGCQLEQKRCTKH